MVFGVAVGVFSPVQMLDNARSLAVSIKHDRPLIEKHGDGDRINYKEAYVSGTKPPFFIRSFSKVAPSLNGRICMHSEDVCACVDVKNNKIHTHAHKERANEFPYPSIPLLLQLL